LNVLDLETGETRELTTSTAEDELPALSPDGTRIAFGRGIRGSTINNLYLVNLDGTGEIALTTGDHGDTWPSWSPDGQEIVFQSSHRGDQQIFLIRPDGTDLRPLLPTADVARVYLHPTWSPTGDWIALTVSEGFNGVYHLHLVAPDGSGLHQLTNEPGAQEYPKFSPDGRQVAYATTGASLALPYLIKTIRTDGTGSRVLTTPEVDGVYPAWAPEGDRLAFMSLNDTTLYTVNLSGLGLGPLLEGQVHGFAPSWGPRP
jgi:TolB protein